MDVGLLALTSTEADETWLKAEKKIDKYLMHT